MTKRPTPTPSPIPTPIPTPTPSPSPIEETKTETEKCPDILVRQGNQLLLINTKIPQVPGKNPIYFNSLDDYIYYIKVQRNKYGKYCPVLYLQQESNAQGQDTYRVRPGPFDMQGGLPTTTISDISNFFQGNLGKPMVPYTDANITRPPFNQGFFGFDPQNEYIGKYTILDKIHYSTQTQNPSGLSSNAMDPNWAGAQFTNAQLKELDKSIQTQTTPSQ